MSNPKLADVYAILDFQTCLERNLDPRRVVRSWFDAGIELVQIRAKNLNDLNYWVFAETIRECSLPYQTTLIINARVDIAAGLELDGVHLPTQGLPIDAIRKAYPKMLILASCHNEDEIAQRRTADGLTFSPVFTPNSKPDDSRVKIGLSAFEKAAVSFPGKMYALGGIDEKHIGEMRTIPVASLGFLCQKNAFQNAKILLFKGNL